MQKTDIGMIPVDWDWRPLSELGEPKIGLTYSPADVRESGTLVLRSSNVHNDRLAFDDNVYVRSEIASGSLVEPGDVLICVRNGSRALIGKCALIDESARGMAFGAFMSVFRSPHSALLFQQFRSDIIGRQIAEHLGATINQITNGSLKSFRVPFPPDGEERRRIAQALNDVDDLIASLDALIAKTRDIKQGAMQQLLSGTRRLPGFCGEWKTRPVGTEIRMQVGFPFQSAYFNGEGKGIRIIRIRDLKGQINETFYLGEYDRQFIVKSGDVLIGMDGDFSPCVWLHGEAILNQRVGRLLHRRGGHTLLFYYLLTKPLSELERTISGTTVKHLSHSDVENIICHYPVDPAEQAALGETLWSFDQDLSGLEEKKVKLGALRQAMMQQLLMGRIRLI